MSTARSRRALGTALGVLFVAQAGAVHGQSAGPRDLDSASRGLLVPGEGRTGEASSLALETNPAQLGFLRSADATWVSNVWSHDTALPGRGHGFFFGVPLGPLGLATDLMDLQGLADGPSHRWRFSLGFGLSLGDRFALGGSWHRIFDHAPGGFSAYDLGLSMRLVDPLAVAVTLEDVNQPGGASVRPRRWTGELLLRPLGTRTVELAGGFRHSAHQDWEDGTPMVRARFILPRAFSLFAEASFPARAFGAQGGGTRDTLVSVGLGFTTSNLRLQAAGLGVFPSADAPGSSSSNDAGGSFAVSLTGLGAPRLTDHVVRFDVHELGDERRLLGFLLALERVANDPTATAVYLRVNDPGLGLGRIEEVRDRLHALRARGKRVFVHLRSPDKRDLYLALAADRIYVDPLANIVLGGFSANRLWWKGALDKLGVRGELARIAEYKGAMEPFVYDAETAAVRANTQAIVDDDYHRVLATLTAERPKAAPDLAAAEALLARGLLLPAEAKKLGLIDEVLDQRDGEDALRKELGAPHIGIHDLPRAPETPRRWFGARVAVVLVDGTITDEEGGGLPFGRSGTAADKLERALENLEHSGDVRAILVRVNSPGGSAYASERIARALARLKKKGRPVVVSFGDIAASGGYYVATQGDLVFAEPSTLTGSIGVFAFKIDLSALMGRLGVFEERASRGVPAEPFSPYHPWSEGERQAVERSIRHIYDTFLARVVEGRHKKGLDDATKVDAIARGQVWTGSQAHGVGLVDHGGDFVRALEAAANLGRVPRDEHGLPRITVVPAQDWKTQLLKSVGDDLSLLHAGLEGAGQDEASLEKRPAGRHAGLVELGLAAQALATSVEELLLPGVLWQGGGFATALPFVLTVE